MNATRVPQGAPEHGAWHLDRRVPIGLMAAVLIQAAGLVWWGSAINQRVATIERSTASTSNDATRITRLEVQLDNMQRTVEKMDGKLDRLLQQPGRN